MPKVGDIVNGSVVKILQAGALIQMAEGATGFIHISQISADFVRDVNDYLKIGDAVTARVVTINEAERKTFLSIHLVDEKEYEKYKANEGKKPPYKPKKPTNKPAYKPRREEPLDPAKLFEKKMKDFLSDSQDKFRIIQKNKDRKQGGRKKPKQK